MALDLERIRTTAQRVAASHGLDVVEIEFQGAGKFRELVVFLEKNAAGRAAMKAKLEAATSGKVAESEEQIEAEVEAETEAEIAASLPMVGLEAEAGMLSGVGASSDAVAWHEDIPSGLRGSLEQLSFVTHEDCAAFSSDFGTVLDVEDLIPGAEYTLEVSSPGLDRKLNRPEDYRRFQKSLVKVQTREPVSGNRFWQGRLVDVTDDGFVLDLSGVKQKKSGAKGKSSVSRVELGFANVEKANLVAEI